jgi:hypothetical protein
MQKQGKKKRKKVTPYRKLFLKAERLWKQGAFDIYGKECMVKKFYPQINITHTEVFQVDHVVTRADKNLFFHPHNRVPVCSSCNRAKGFKQKGVDFAIQQIVIRRIGGQAFGEMMDIHQTAGPNYNWKKVWWIEQVVQNLETFKIHGGDNEDDQ